MSEKQWTIAGVAVGVAFGVPAWWSLFIEHPETVTAMTWALRVMTPVVTFMVGAFTGWHLRRWVRPVDQTHSMDGTINTNLTAVRSMSPLMAKAMLDARNAAYGEREVTGKVGAVVDESYGRNDGVFFIKPTTPGHTRYYALKTKWVEYLMDETVLKELAKRAKEPY